jgi:hypothetical protein
MAFTEKRLAGPTALTANTETNLYVCPTAQTTTTQIKQVLVTNTGSATTFDLSLVPLGGTAGTANRLFSALALSANETVLLDVSQVMSSGDFISAKSGAGSTVNVTISGVENSGLMVVSGLADSAVTTAKIADGNITAAKLGPDIFADIFQSNVVTSTTRPLAPFEGQVIYESDTDRVLVWNASAWVAPNSTTANPPGLELVGISEFTGTSIVELNNVFSSSYDSYKVVSAWWGSANTNTQFRFHTGTNTPDTNTLYYRYGAYYAGGSWINFANNGENQMFWGNHNSTSGIASVTEITFNNPFRSDSRTVAQHQHWDASSGLLAHFASQHVNYTSFTGFRVYPSSGTITGSISVYGYRN